VHHFVGIENNRINMANIPGVHEDLKIGVTLSPLQDSFYKDNMYSDFGVIGDAVQALSQQLQRQTNSKDKIQNLEDVKKFLTEFPELKKLSGSVSKHVALIGEIQRQTKMRQMFDCSELEQELSAEHELEAHVAKMKALLTGEGRQDEITGQPLPFKPLLKEDAIRLVLLFTLRYESEAAGEIQQFTQILQQRYELTTAQQGLVQLIKAYGGLQARSPSADLFDTSNTLKNFANTFTKGLTTGVQNVYQRHKTLVEKLAQIISENALSDVDFPFAGPVGNQRPTEVLFFIVGGATFEEAAVIHKLNDPANPTKTQYLLGGTSITSPYTYDNLRCIANSF
jgi:vacuolar protein sorting-associated protein 45